MMAMATEWRRGAVIVLAGIVIAGCGGLEPNDVEPAPGIANPASEHCLEVGGQFQIREDPQGGEFGVCVFDDGSECEEWALYRGECEPGQEP